MIQFETIQSAIEEVTGKRAERHDILADLAEDSLERMEIAVQVEIALDIHITDAELERLETAGDLHDLVNRKKGLSDAETEEEPAAGAGTEAGA